MIADKIWILTAFSVVPQNFLTLRCCFSHLKKVLSAIYSCKGWRFQELLDDSHSTCTFTPPFFLRNVAHQKTDKHNRTAVESKAFQPKDIRNTFLSGMPHHTESRIFKDMVVTILIGRSKCRFRNRLTS